MLFGDAVGIYRFLENGITVPVRIVAPSGRAAETLAQVDTGSTVSSVDRSLLRGLERLPPLGHIQIDEVTGSVALGYYSYAITLRDGTVLTPGPILADTLPPPAQCLLGREVLERMQLVIDGPTGSWRAYTGVPSARRLGPGLPIAAGLVLAWEMWQAINGGDRRGKG